MVSWSDISVIVITLNAVERLPFVLRSVRGAGEIVIVDGGSSDGTAERAESLGCRVIRHPFRSFVEQKQIALHAATKPWVLNVDTDERVSEALYEEIERTEPGDDVGGFEIPFLHFFWGRWLRHGGWWPDAKVRLVRREWASIQAGGWFVHESLTVTRGGVVRMKAPMVHDSYRDLGDVIRKLERYSRLGAYDLYLMGRKSTFWHRVISPHLTFFHHYIVRGGFLDGRPGLWAARIRAWGTALKYWRLWEIQRGLMEPPPRLDRTVD